MPQQVSKSLRSPRHRALTAYIVAKRKQAGLTQIDFAERIGRNQSFVSLIETGQRRIDVVEFLEIAEAIGFDPRDAIKRLRAVKSR